MRRKIITLFMVAWILCMIPMAAFAQNFEADRKGSISITLKEQDGKTPIAGVELSLYYVASVSLNSYNNLSYRFTTEFMDCGTAIDDSALAAKLDEFVEVHASPVTKGMTDQNGKVVFSDLPLGLYFVKQLKGVTGYAPCTPFLVTVPTKNTDGFVFDVNASPKTEIEKLVSITVKKVWNTDESTRIADSVTVRLLRNGNVVKTAKLTAGNDWKVTYADMPASDSYSILEVNVPNGFTATYSQNGYVFTVTNSASLIQTGQLFWPIPVLAIVGLSLIGMGAIILRKPRENDA